MTKDDSALLTNYTPPGFSGGGGDDVVPVDDNRAAIRASAGTCAGRASSQLRLRRAASARRRSESTARRRRILQFSHLTTLAVADRSPDPARRRSRISTTSATSSATIGSSSTTILTTGCSRFKYDLGTETLDDQLRARPSHRPGAADRTVAVPATPADRPPPPFKTIPIAQTQRSAVLRYNGDPTTPHPLLARRLSRATSAPSARASIRARVSSGRRPATPRYARRSERPSKRRSSPSSSSRRPPTAFRSAASIYIGNPTLQPDHATDYDLGMEQIFGTARRPLHLSIDLYQTNLRSPSSQLNVAPDSALQTKPKPTPCPISMPVNAGNGIYRGIDVHADSSSARPSRARRLGRRQFVPHGHSADIQNGTLVRRPAIARASRCIRPTSRSKTPRRRAWPTARELNYEGCTTS